jgi:hypothetical protein
MYQGMYATGAGAWMMQQLACPGQSLDSTREREGGGLKVTNERLWRVEGAEGRTRQ